MPSPEFVGVKSRNPTLPSSIEQARASLQQALVWHQNQPIALQAAIQTSLEQLSGLNHKLNQGVIQIAAFGLVGCGKSAVLNALYGEQVFPTGPLHGVTQWPRSLRWLPTATELPLATTAKIQIELIDTPGLDEANGEIRAQMAREIAHQADVILFVTVGELTQSELTALAELRSLRKPLLLVLNKLDLHPHLDPQTIYQTVEAQGLQQLISPEEIVLTAAAPAPVQVRVEWPNGRTTYEWEAAPPQIQPLKQKLLQLLNCEGEQWLILNVLLQAQATEQAIAHQILQMQEAEAETLLGQFLRRKALLVAISPLLPLDLLGGFVADLLLIRALTKLYGLPMTRYGAGKLWQTLLTSSGSLFLAEWGSNLAFNWGRDTTFFTDSLGGIATYVSTTVAQAGVAAYGAYLLGYATQTYLRKGSTWGSTGPSTLIQNLLNHLQPNTILGRLQQEIRDQLV